MSNAKKPAVVAKTAKKRGRPVGSKNKVYQFTYNSGVGVDWEKLAKQLQVALSSEIKEHDQTQAYRNKLFADLHKTRTFWERLVYLFTGKL